MVDSSTSSQLARAWTSSFIKPGISFMGTKVSSISATAKFLQVLQKLASLKSSLNEVPRSRHLIGVVLIPEDGIELRCPGASGVGELPLNP